MGNVILVTYLHTEYSIALGNGIMISIACMRTVVKLLLYFSYTHSTGKRAKIWMNWLIMWRLQRMTSLAVAQQHIVIMVHESNVSTFVRFGLLLHRYRVLYYHIIDLWHNWFYIYLYTLGNWKYAYTCVVGLLSDTCNWITWRT